MTNPQPIDEWFGMEKPAKPKPTVYTREQREKAKADAAEYANEPIAGITEDECWFRHYNWREKRARVLQALRDAQAADSAIENFENCGSSCQVEWSDVQQRYRVCGSYCHSRHCEPCMRAKSALITTNLRQKMASAGKSQYRFITLTLRHSDQPLKQQIARLYASYKRLRTLPEWKGSQRGGAATLEVKWQADSKKWHPHLHLISEGDYVSTYWLSAAWRAITGDSHVVDIRLISAEKDVAYYVGKYVTKGTNSAVWEEPAVAAEWVKAVKGVRMCATFGSWRGFKLLAREPETPGEWQHVASLGSLVRRAHAGEVYARELLIILVQAKQYDPHQKRSPKPK